MSLVFEGEGSAQMYIFSLFLLCCFTNSGMPGWSLYCHSSVPPLSPVLLSCFIFYLFLMCFEVLLHSCYSISSNLSICNLPPVYRFKAPKHLSLHIWLSLYFYISATERSFSLFVFLPFSTPFNIKERMLSCDSLGSVCSLTFECTNRKMTCCSQSKCCVSNIGSLLCSRGIRFIVLTEF